MKGNMKVQVMVGIMQLSEETRPIPQAKPGQVLVRVRHVGVCGSDLHYFEHGRIGGYVVKPPFLLGHEAAGEVAEVGDGVTTLKVGDRVALEPGVVCGHCEFCKRGLYNLCPSVEFFATPPFDGTFAEYVTHPAELCFKLPDNVDTVAGALIEPLAVGFHAAMQGGARVGMTTAVLGCGCIGLSTMLALKAMGVSEVYMIDVLSKRVDMAGSLGANAYNAAKTDAVRAIIDATGGVDLVVETAGSPQTILDTVTLIKRGGRIVLVGLAPDAVQPFNVGGLIDKEAQVNTVFRYRNIYPMAISAVKRGLNIASIVTDVFPFQDTDRALKYNVEFKRDVVKAVISIP